MKCGNDLEKEVSQILLHFQTLQEDTNVTLMPPKIAVIGFVAYQNH